MFRAVTAIAFGAMVKEGIDDHKNPRRASVTHLDYREYQARFSNCLNLCQDSHSANNKWSGWGERISNWQNVTSLTKFVSLLSILADRLIIHVSTDRRRPIDRVSRLCATQIVAVYYV